MNDKKGSKTFDPILDYYDSDNELEAYYRIVQTNVISVYYWYKRHKDEERRSFRTAGASVILLSITISAISAYNFIGKDVIVSIMALSIALFSGFNTFFKWEETWRVFSKSELAIHQLISIWQLQIYEAKKCADKNVRLAEASKATRYLLDEVGKIISQETDNYFSKVEWPKKQG